MERLYQSGNKRNNRQGQRKGIKKLEIQYNKKAVKAISAMDKDTKHRIKRAIEGLTLTPPQGNIKPMQGYKDGRYRLRVGQYRIIYRYDNSGAVEILLIMDIGTRGDIYK